MSIRVEHIRGTTTEIESVTPQVAELGFDTTKKEAHIGDGATAGGIRIGKKNIREVLAPAQITVATNDYNPTGMKHAAVLVLSLDAAHDLTGIVPSTVTDSNIGRELTLFNSSSFNLTLRNLSGSSSSANQIDLGGTDIVVGAKQSVTLRYSGSVWQLVASTAGAAVASGAVIAKTLAASAMAFAGMINGTLVPSVGSSALTVALKTLAGADPSVTDPVYVIFRDVTAATGDYAVLTVTAATSFVLSSGSSCGVAANNTAFKLWVVGFNDAGTFRLGMINCRANSADIYPLSAWGIASSTAEGGAGAADNAQTFYTGVAVTAKAYATLGYMTWESGLAAVGTWSAVPTRAQLYGPGVPLPGTMVQKALASSGAVATGTTVLPFDDTIPQNTEGDQYLSKAITPSSAANLLRIDSTICFGSSAASSWSGVALFQDTTANALASQLAFQTTTTGTLVPRLFYEMLAGTTSSTTFKIRAGAGTAGTTTFNGAAGSREHGGVLSSFLQIEEIAT